MSKIDKKWLDKNCTKNGGYTKRQLEIIEVDWPPQRGWKIRCVGKEIDDEDKKEFERLGKRTV